MEKRIVLYNFESILNNDQIVNRFIENRFTKDANSGFSISKNNNSGIYFRHIKKIINIDRVVTPFGDEYENTTVDYAINEVKIKDNTLHIINPTRSLTPFRTDLLKSLGFQCTLSNKVIKLNEILLLLRDGIFDVNLTDIELTSHDLFKDSRVKMVISSNSDLIRKTEPYLIDINSVLTKIGFFINLDGEKYYVELGCKGSLKITGALVDNKIEDLILNRILI